MITLGKKYKDSITGFEGIAVSRTVYLHGCVHIGLQPNKLHDGKPVPTEYFDEQRVDPESKANTGGPNDHPPARSKAK